MGIMEMSDAQINLAIAEIEYPEAVREGINYVFNVDYVNNWSDIRPIIEREKIDLFIFIEDIWCAEWGEYDYSGNRFAIAEAKTPTKAAALCYLKMKGVE